MKSRIPENMTELRDDMLKLFVTVDDGDIAVAKEKNSAARNIIKSASVQLEYQLARKETPSIPFLK